MVECLLDLFGLVDLALFQAAAQFFHCHVHVDDFVRSLQKAIGYGLTDLNAGRTSDSIIQGFQVLDIDSGHHMDAFIQQVQHVPVTLLVFGTRNIGVS